MELSRSILDIVYVLIFFRLGAEILLDILNAREANSQPGKIPDEMVGEITDEQYSRSVEYTLARTRFHSIHAIWGSLFLVLFFATDLFPALYGMVLSTLGTSVYAQGAFLIITGFVISIPDLPFELWSQFRIEERFGFNKSSFKLWLVDQVKGMALGMIIGYPILVLVLSLVGWMGANWWIWAFALIFTLQIFLLILFPRYLLPLFNKLENLPDGSLKERLVTLAKKVSFPVARIQVMDGSKRSGHSNAFFTGFGKFRHIVLFDTLIDQLEEEQVEGVLAHEIGHYCKGHIFKMLFVQAGFLLGGLYVIDFLFRTPEFSISFGFQPGELAPVFLLLSLTGGLVTFWLSPIINLFSRKNEFEADAFALETMGTAKPLEEALKIMAKENLSNLRPHPLYSIFYSSHPSLNERRKALATGPT